MPYTVTWWVEGAPAERYGGPYWANEYDSKEEARKFILNILTFCKEVYWHEGPICMGERENVEPPAESFRMPLPEEVA